MFTALASFIAIVYIHRRDDGDAQNGARNRRSRRHRRQIAGDNSLETKTAQWRRIVRQAGG